jgi:hypothetical protein
MGASGWSYFVPYQEDIAQALHDLRERVFQAGEYYKPDEWYAELRSRGIITEEEYQDNILEINSQSVPDNIDELVELRGEEGTHSIIDIEGVSTSAFPGTISPLSNDEYLELFGTQRPSHSLVEEKEEALQSIHGPFCGTYIYIYEKEKPVEIFITGISGD